MSILNIILTIAFIFLATMAVASAAPWVPTRRRDVERMLALAKIQPGEVFYDLGCGDGRLIEAAAHAGAKAIGFDISLLPYLITRVRLSLAGSEAKIRFKNLFSQNLSEANIIYLFLMPTAINKAKNKFEKELKKGTRVISYVFPIPGWTPVQVDKPPGCVSIYLYIV